MKISKYLTFVCLLCLSPFLNAQESADEEDDEQPGFDELTKNSNLFDGLFKIYRDQKSGQVHLGIRPEQLDQQFIYVTVTDDGVVEGGHFRGFYRENTVISVRRHFDRVEFVKENTNFYFNPESPIARASNANTSPAILATQKILATHEDTGEILIAGDDIFLGEALHPVKPTPPPDFDPKKAFSLGDLSKDKNKIYSIKNYPKNTIILVEYVYENPAPIVQGQPDIADSRYVSIRMQHTFIEMPDNVYEPRRDDPRVGYFITRIDDLTDSGHTPYRDLIRRWDLQKKDPNAALSEPKEPIVWWIENTTPLEWRDLITKSALVWNQSFEKAGFKNAVQVKVQPDDASWDAGDIRYNVLRWTSSPQPPFGGYGPSFINPLTGQILGADIMLEYSFMTRRLRIQKLLKVIQAGGSLEGEAGVFCSAGYSLHLNNLFAANVAELTGGSPGSLEQLEHDAMHYLILHEIGHTLGLNHNMKASNLLDNDEIFDANMINDKGLTGSVMDYPAVNVAHLGKPQTLYYTTRPGYYDDWAIEFGYSPELADDTKRQAHLDRSTDPNLIFGNDADDMRSAGKAIDPRVNINDMSSDGIGHSVDRMALIDDVMDKLLNKFQTPGESYQELYNSYVILAAQHQAAANTVSRFIGGVQVNRAMVGQPGATTPYVPVSATEQKRAMNTLSNQVFAPDAFSGNEALYSHLRQQRRDFDFWAVSEDPKIHDLNLNIQKGVLDHLLHATVQKRITDSGLYGNDYNVTDVMTDLTNAIFEADIRGNVNTARQNLQMEYVNRLVGMVSGETKKAYDYPSQSAALNSLRQVEAMLQSARRGNSQTAAHRQNVLYTIERGLNED